MRPFITVELNDGIPNELADPSLIVFDPNKRNDSAVGAKKTNKCIKTSRAHQPLNAQVNQSKRIDDKRFKCEFYDSCFRFSQHLKNHWKIDANGNFIGIKPDSIGLYRCRLCVRRFTNVGCLQRHMHSHKKSEYLYDCTHCLRQFVHEADKDQHERR